MQRRISLCLSLVVIVLCGSASLSLAAEVVPAHAHAGHRLRDLHVPKPREVQIRKDPFMSPVDDEGRDAPTAITPTADDPALMQNSAAGNIPGTQAAIPILAALRGVVIGDHSYAVIDEGGNQRIVSVGDTVAQSKIVRITLKGIDLQNGMHITSSEGKQ